MWARLMNIAIGIWLMAAPAVLDYGRPASTSDLIVGPLVASFACIALWEATRSVRWINLPMGLWIVVSPWVLGHPAGAAVNAVCCGVAIAGLACLGGHVRQRFAGGWTALWREPAGQ